MVFPTATLDPKPFKAFDARPAPDVIRSYAEQIVATGHPELIPDLYHQPIGKDEPFLNLRPLEVAKDRRADGTMMPCPRCATPNKFLSGWLIFLTDLKAIACVGNDCAGGAVQMAANREYEERLKREQEEEYLLEALPMLRDALAEAALLAPRAEVATALHKALRKLKEPFAALRDAARNGGQLSVNEVMQTTSGGPSGIRTRGSSVQTRTVRFGLLAGAGAFVGAFDPLKAIQEVRAAFEKFQCHDDNAALEAVASMTDEQRAAAYKSVKKSYKRLAEARADLDGFSAFFTDANLDRVNEWGRHQDAPVAIELILRGQGDGASRLDYKYRSGATADFASIPIRPGYI
ncbi:MAG: hypothetical protein B7Y43_03605 [Sphingomonas sp. 28-62-20]|uniref:hypothetical protein n=1 Tax=Sphingomonas sp. 28-62-20 TaxID=1970433 RepID=UPI000BDB9B06|nr:MAG: hypothetical protein B7Y43_03605 [Sphingomonas sp. 28-62-20]